MSGSGDWSLYYESSGTGADTLTLPSAYNFIAVHGVWAEGTTGGQEITLTFGANDFWYFRTPSVQTQIGYEWGQHPIVGPKGTNLTITHSGADTVAWIYYRLI
jgi:hypothetical protein